MPMIVAPAIVSTNGNVVLNDPGTTAVGRWIVDIAVTVGTFTIKPQKRLKVDPSVTAHSFADCWYVLALTNASTPAGTTQTTNCILDIDASGCDVQLVVTVGGGGLVEIFATPLTG